MLHALSDFLSVIWDSILGFVSGIAQFYEGSQKLFQVLIDFSYQFAGFLPVYIILLIQFLIALALILFVIKFVLKVIEILTLGFGGG